MVNDDKVVTCRPTMEIMFQETLYNSDKEFTPFIESEYIKGLEKVYYKLQQKWVCSDGSTFWEDVKISRI